MISNLGTDSAKKEERQTKENRDLDWKVRHLKRMSTRVDILGSKTLWLCPALREVHELASVAKGPERIAPQVLELLPTENFREYRGSLAEPST